MPYKRLSLYIKRDDIIEPSNCGNCGEYIDEHHGKMVSCNLIWVKTFTKEQAIEFAKKYMKDRKLQYVHPTNIPIGITTPRELNEKLEHVWNCAVEYAILDIIPYLYGEALD